MSSIMKIRRLIVILTLCCLLFSNSNAKYITHILEVMPENPIGAIIFLHCAGDTGQSFKRLLDLVRGSLELFNGMHLIFPTAPLRKYSAFGGDARLYHVWFDEQQYTPSGKEDLAVLYRVGEEITEIIKNETRYNIPPKNVFIGGLGMGGSMALHVAYRHFQQVGGVFALSSFLKRRSKVFKDIKIIRRRNKGAKFPEVFMCQGEEDVAVRPEWSAITFRKFSRLGIKGVYHSMPGVMHELKKEEIIKLDKWIIEKLNRK